jgi:hypothetical protein
MVYWVRLRGCGFEDFTSSISDVLLVISSITRRAAPPRGDGRPLLWRIGERAIRVRRPGCGSWRSSPSSTVGGRPGRVGQVASAACKAQWLTAGPARNKAAISRPRAPIGSTAADRSEQAQYYMSIAGTCSQMNIVCKLYPSSASSPAPFPPPGLLSFAFDDADQTFINAFKAAGLVTGRVGVSPITGRHGDVEPPVHGGRGCARSCLPRGIALPARQCSGDLAYRLLMLLVPDFGKVARNHELQTLVRHDLPRTFFPDTFVKIGDRRAQRAGDLK